MTDIYAYGTIGSAGWWDDDGFTAGDMREALDGAAGDDVTVHVNSGGGDVFDATTMAALVTQYRLRHPGATVTTVVEGLAASAASYLGLTSDEVVIYPGAMMMVHDPSGGCYGQAQDMRRMADSLDAVRDSIAGLYADKAGTPADEWVEHMAAETWYTAAEAVEAGLADRVADGAQAVTASVDPRIRAEWRHAPEPYREVAGDAGESIQDEVPEAGQADEGEAAAQGAEVGAEAAPRAIYAGGTVLVTRQ